MWTGLVPHGSAGEPKGSQYDFGNKLNAVYITYVCSAFFLINNEFGIMQPKEDDM